MTLLTSALRRVVPRAAGSSSLLAPTPVARAGVSMGGIREGSVHGREHVRPSGGQHEDGASHSQYGHEAPAADRYNFGPVRAWKERGFIFSRGRLEHNWGKIWPEISQRNLPFWYRRRLLNYTNLEFQVFMEFCFFYIPSFLLFGLAMPSFITLYVWEDCHNCDMVVKVTGRQWYWVYEVESPTGDGDEDDD